MSFLRVGQGVRESWVWWMGVCALVVSVALLTGCSGSGESERSGAVPDAVEGAQPLGATSCTKEGKQTVCYYVTNKTMKWTSKDGDMDTMDWKFVDFTSVNNSCGKHPHNWDKQGANPARPDTIQEDAYWKMYQPKLTSDAGGSYQYKSDAYPGGDQVELEGCNPNTGDNKADCRNSQSGDYKYTICISNDPDTSGGTTSADFTLMNLPLQVQVQNNLDKGSLELSGSPSTTNVGLAPDIGTPEKTVASKSSVNWLGYRQPSSNEMKSPMPEPSPSTTPNSYNDFRVTYKVTGDEAFTNSSVSIDVNVDTFGNPQASKCTAQSGSSYQSIYCDVTPNGPDVSSGRCWLA